MIPKLPADFPSLGLKRWYDATFPTTTESTTLCTQLLTHAIVLYFRLVQLFYNNTRSFNGDPNRANHAWRLSCLIVSIGIPVVSIFSLQACWLVARITVAVWTFIGAGAYLLAYYAIVLTTIMVIVFCFIGLRFSQQTTTENETAAGAASTAAPKSQIRRRTNAKHAYTDTATDCSICLGPLNGGLSSGCSRTLPCYHRYHVACINKWLATNNNKTCPLCRGPIT